MTAHNTTSDSVAAYCDYCDGNHDDPGLVSCAGLYISTFAELATLSEWEVEQISANSEILLTMTQRTRDFVRDTALLVAERLDDEADAIDAGAPVALQPWLGATLPRLPHIDYDAEFISDFADTVRDAGWIVGAFPYDVPNSEAEELASHGVLRVAYLQNLEELRGFNEFHELGIQMQQGRTHGIDLPDSLIELAEIHVDLNGVMKSGYPDYAFPPQFGLDAGEALRVIDDRYPDEWFDPYPNWTVA